MTPISRRSFIRRSAAVAGGGALGAVALPGFVNHPAALTAVAAENNACRTPAPLGEGGYGPLRPAGPELALPAGFRYVTFGVTGSIMSDGRPTPAGHDGMGAFWLPNGNVRLVRNHEIRGTPGATAPLGDPAKAYDPKAGGGTTSLEVRVNRDGTRQLVRDFVSLGGTIVNCAGGVTPWETWLTCEEATSGPSTPFSGTTGRLDKGHGYVYEVSALSEGQEGRPEPRRALGRFVHEAVAIDPRSRILYETEDFRYEAGNNSRPGSGFYRFIQADPVSRDLVNGKLQMLAIKDRPAYNTTRGQRIGQPLAVAWVNIGTPDPDAAETDPSAVFRQGLAKGGAIFNRLEGAWYGDESIFFNSTNGGDAGLGQVWQYRPRGTSGGVLTLLFEPTTREELDGPDNITVSPGGGLVLCEDGAGEQYVRGLTREGRIFDFARNLENESEFAGACFSPDGETMFVNIQTPGKTFAIWGPWELGAL